ELDALEAVALDAADAVERRNVPVDVGVARREQVDDAAVLLEDAAREELELGQIVGTRVAAARGVREDVRVRVDLVQPRHVEPLEHEVARERARARVREHALDLRLEHGVVAELAADREAEQLFVRDRVPEEERKLRRERDIVEAINLARRDAVRRRLDAIEEMRAREHARQRAAYALLEARELVPFVVVREEIDEVALRERPPVGERAEARQDLLGAGTRLDALVRMAAEDPRPARRLAEAARIERPADLERRDAEHAVLAAAGHEHLGMVVRLGE